MAKCVNQAVTDEMVTEAERLENNPRLIMALIDLMFLNEDPTKVIPS